MVGSTKLSDEGGGSASTSNGNGGGGVAASVITVLSSLEVVLHGSAKLIEGIGLRDLHEFCVKVAWGVPGVGLSSSGHGGMRSIVGVGSLSVDSIIASSVRGGEHVGKVPGAISVLGAISESERLSSDLRLSNSGNKVKIDSNMLASSGLDCHDPGGFDGARPVRGFSERDPLDLGDLGVTRVISEGSCGRQGCCGDGGKTGSGHLSSMVSSTNGILSGHGKI